MKKILLLGLIALLTLGCTPDPGQNPSAWATSASAVSPPVDPEKSFEPEEAPSDLPLKIRSILIHMKAVGVSGNFEIDSSHGTQIGHFSKSTTFDFVVDLPEEDAVVITVTPSSLARNFKSNSVECLIAKWDGESNSALEAQDKNGDTIIPKENIIIRESSNGKKEIRCEWINLPE